MSLTDPAQVRHPAQAASQGDADAPTLVVRDLVAHYGSEKAVDGLSFTIRPGELVTLLGPSGCGKTTSLRCVAGLHVITSGSIAIDGRIVSSERVHVRPERRSLNMVFQSYALWPHMDVFDNVAYGLRAQHLPRAEVTQRAEDMLKLVGLEGYGPRSASALSGGQQQRVVLARALVTRPTLLLLDEPLSNLDSELRVRMRTEIHALQRQLGLSMLYVTHDRAEALSLSDWVIVMREGRAQQIGRPGELYAHPVNRYVAEALGPVNVFQGTLTSLPPRPVVTLTQLAGAPTLPLADALPGELPPSTGREIEVLIRPEWLDIHPVESGSDGITAEVTLVEFLGSKTEVTCRNGEQSFKIERADPLTGVEAGDRVLVKLRDGPNQPLPTWRPITTERAENVADIGHEGFISPGVNVVTKGS